MSTDTRFNDHTIDRINPDGERMRVASTLLLIVLSACAHLSPKRLNDVDAVIASEPHFSGIVAVSRNGVTIHEAGYGLRDRASQAPHMANEVFRYASVSKMITAILVLQEVDRGRMSLDAPVATYLKTARIENADTITVRNLLAHKSGLSEQQDLSVAGPDGRIADPLEYCRKASGGAGKEFRYNNCDTIILGLALEAVTGMDYLALVNKRFSSIGVKLSMPATQRVEAYMDEERSEDPVLPTAYGPAGGLYGSARDLLAIDNALLEGRLISKAAMAEMMKGDPSIGYAALSVWSYAPDLKSCLGETPLVERYGEINGVQVRNFLLPRQAIAIVVYANDRRVNFGEIWRGEGFAIDLLRAAACSP